MRCLKGEGRAFVADKGQQGTLEEGYNVQTGKGDTATTTQTGRAEKP